MRQEGDHSIAEVGLPAKEDNDCHTSRALYSSFLKMVPIDQPSMDPRVVIPKRRMRCNHSVPEKKDPPSSPGVPEVCSELARAQWSVFV